MHQTARVEESIEHVIPCTHMHFPRWVNDKSGESWQSCEPVQPDFYNRLWIRDFLNLSRLEGYQKKNVTPYMHCLVYHVPQQIRTHGNIIKFSGQGRAHICNDTYIHGRVEHTCMYTYQSVNNSGEGSVHTFCRSGKEQ